MPTFGDAVGGAEGWFTERPAVPRSGVGAAVLHAIGVLIAMIVGLTALELCTRSIDRSHPEQALLISGVVLLISVVVWLGTVIWMGRHAGTGMGILAFFLTVIAWPVYVYRQKRGLVSRQTKGAAPPYPAYSLAAILVVCSLVLGGLPRLLADDNSSVAALVPQPTVATGGADPTTQPTNAATTAPTATVETTPTPKPTPKVDRQKEANAAAAVVVDLTKREMSGEFNAIYDMLHPDAHAAVPRGAVVGWYRHDYGPRGPRTGKVVEVRFIEWTWAVTGKTYQGAIEVTYRQPFNDGSTDTSVLRLVKHKDNWRPFFGESRAFIDEQVKKYVVTTEISGTDLAAIPYDVDEFWRRTFDEAGIDYDSAEYFQFKNRVRSSCGRIAADYSPAFYCSADMTIYTAAWFQEAVVTDVGDFAWVVVIAHEWGHHVEAELGLWNKEIYSMQFELEADCLAGVYAQDAEARGLIESGDIEAALTLLMLIGDPEGVSVYDPDAHGTSEQRAEAFLNGYHDGLTGCGYTT